MLDSLFDRTGYENFELIVVDNQSEDPDLASYLQDLRDRVSQTVRVMSEL